MELFKRLTNVTPEEANCRLSLFFPFLLTIVWNVFYSITRHDSYIHTCFAVSTTHMQHSRAWSGYYNTLFRQPTQTLWTLQSEIQLFFFISFFFFWDKSWTYTFWKGIFLVFVHFFFFCIHPGIRHIKNENFFFFSTVARLLKTENDSFNYSRIPQNNVTEALI